jgi:hypothetical protein
MADAFEMGLSNAVAAYLRVLAASSQADDANFSC